jgi:TetR/AcrR family transcriptional regulator, repressor for uid operon
MPKLKPAIQQARRDHILDAAERCVARAGFHRTTMQDICREAGVSPGALYVYFDSKEALIAGICERDRAEFAERLAGLAEAPDFLAALGELGNHYFVCQPKASHLMCIEVGLESTRNPRIAEIHQSVDEFISSSFEKLFQRMEDEGRIAPEVPIPVVVKLFSVIADGLFWRRAVDPTFDGAVLLPATLELMARLLRPTPPADSRPSPTSGDRS